ncbi:MAG: hypothetical protein TR69_WS6001000865 [candidate division WS6 bacterium OLB20]|uniref:Uncharacterized protein n=1 Tax=candidate division WS6 bacterium OLB20 TaxID=1617426 RepID=A0A136LYU4_9BACT|nr:MAG: hypothetical protein TR69_WS6001000865 [candidate division WS6 bacterium OLB20]
MSKHPLLSAFGITTLAPDPAFRAKQRKRFVRSVSTSYILLIRSMLLRRSVAGALALVLIFMLTFSFAAPRITYARSLSYLALSNTFFHQHSDYDPFAVHDGIILIFDPRIVPAAGAQNVEIMYEYGDPKSCPNYVLTPDVQRIEASVSENGTYQTAAFSSSGEQQFSLTLPSSADVPVLIDPVSVNEESQYTFKCTDDREDIIINSLTRDGRALETLEVSLRDGTLLYRAHVRVF